MMQAHQAGMSGGTQDVAVSAKFEALVQRLVGLGCSIVPKEQWTKELVYTSGPTRLELLEWLIDRFIGAVGDDVPPAASGDHAARTKALTRSAALMGLCSESDTELIEGTPGPGSLLRQVAFMDELSAMVEEAVRLGPAGMQEECARGAKFLSDIAALDLDSVFPAECVLLPPDLARLELPPGLKPSVQRLQDMLAALKVAWEAETKSLAQLDATGSTIGLGDSVEEQRRAVARVGECARQCAALAREFSARFHAELESWTHREPPAVNDVGPRCQRVAEDLRTLQEQLDSVANARMLAGRLKTDHVPSLAAMASDALKGPFGESALARQQQHRALLSAFIENETAPLLAL